MTEIPISNCQEWLNNLKLDDIPKRKVWQRSLMDITGIKHHENMWSDIYSFFFNVNEKHGMKDLFIRSFEQVAGIEKEFLGDFKCDREYVVNNQQRIDLLLKDGLNHRAIIIENKVFHTLNNDLDNYFNSIKGKGYDVRVVVLGLTRYKLKKEYRSVTHMELLDKVWQNFPCYREEANPGYLYLLQEFYKNVKNHSNMIDKEEATFFLKEGNQDKIVRMHDVYRHVKGYIMMVMECKDDKSPLKDHITKLGLRPVSQKTDKGEEYVKYVFKDSRASEKMMLTVFYKNNIMRPERGQRPAIHVVLEIQGDIKKKVEANKDQYISLIGLFDNITPNDKKSNEWWHFASMIIPIGDLTKLSEVVSESINENCPLLKLGDAILTKIQENSCPKTK